VLDELRTFIERDPPADVLSLYVFGSHASGRAHRESDVDLGALLDRSKLPTARDRFERRLELITEFGDALGVGAVRVDVVVLNDAPPLLGRRIVNEGRRVFVRDPDADHAYRRDVQLRAADLEPFVTRTRRVALDALRR
jgi:predicted nucleotidyltransferase